MEKLSLRQKCTRDLGKRVILFKRTIKQWFYHAGIKYLNTHTLSENQELALEDFTDFIVEYMDKISSEDFLVKPKLEPVDLPKKED